MSISYLQRPDGRIAYETAGAGPLIVCIPGMGDLRSSYRHLTPALVAAGYRVTTADLRGHGDSDAAFGHYSDEKTAEDTIALIEQLDGPAVIVGNSMGAAVAVLAAASRPDLVSGIVLIGPFVRNPPTGAVAKALFRVLLAPLWAAGVWNAYLPSLYKGKLPEDFSEYRHAVVAAMRKPGHGAAFSRTTRISHAGAESALPAVSAPTLVVMGGLDPDFRDPAAEAQWIADELRGEIVMVPDAAHYPQSQRPELVAPAIESFLRRVTTDA